MNVYFYLYLTYCLAKSLIQSLFLISYLNSSILSLLFSRACRSVCLSIAYIYCFVVFSYSLMLSRSLFVPHPLSLSHLLSRSLSHCLFHSVHIWLYIPAILKWLGVVAIQSSDRHENRRCRYSLQGKCPSNLTVPLSLFTFRPERHLLQPI